MIVNEIAKFVKLLQPAVELLLVAEVGELRARPLPSCSVAAGVPATSSATRYLPRSGLTRGTPRMV